MTGPKILGLLILVCVMCFWFIQDVRRHGLGEAIKDLFTAIIVGCALIGAFCLLMGYPP